MLLLFATALGSPPRNAVLHDPHGQVLGAAGIALALPALDTNVSYQRMLTDAVGLSVRTDVTHVFGVLAMTTVATRVGPRFSLRRRGLSDWNVRPFILGGVTTLSAGRPLARYGTVGAGAEMGRTWVWGRFVFDLGAGLYSAINLTLVAEESLKKPPGSLPIKPSFHGAFGVAF